MTDIIEDANRTERQSKQWPLYLIVGMVAFVLISGYLLSPRSEESKLAWIEILGTTNKGLLINPPVEVLPGQMMGEDDQNWQPIEDNTWKLMVLVSDECKKVCLDRLKELHAMRIRLNRDAHRLTMGLLSTRSIELSEEVANFHDMNIVKIVDAGLLRELQQTNMPSLEKGPVVLLMNPVDVFMMAYGIEKTGIDMLEDFEHLLDLSN